MMVQVLACGQPVKMLNLSDKHKKIMDVLKENKLEFGFTGHRQFASRRSSDKFPKLSRSNQRP